jgi:hypothetical protein
MASQSNLPAYNLFRYFCSTENAYVYERRVGTASTPTVCKNDGGAISLVSIYQQIPKLNGPLIRNNGSTISELSPNYIDYSSQFIESSDFGSGLTKVNLKADDTITSSDYIWSGQKVNTTINTAISTATSALPLYQVKVSQNDTTASFLSSSIATSNNIRYNIVNPSANEQLQLYVNTSDGINAVDAIWSGNYINTFVNNAVATNSSGQVKITASDTTASYVSSSIIGSGNIAFTTLNAGADEKYQASVNFTDGTLASSSVWSGNYINTFVNNAITSSAPNQVKITANDTTASYVSSSIIGSGNIAFTTLNAGADEKYQASVNFTDGTLTNTSAWSASQIANYVLSYSGSGVSASTSRLYIYSSSAAVPLSSVAYTPIVYPNIAIATSEYGVFTNTSTIAINVAGTYLINANTNCASSVNANKSLNVATRMMRSDAGGAFSLVSDTSRVVTAVGAGSATVVSTINSISFIASCVSTTKFRSDIFLDTSGGGGTVSSIYQYGSQINIIRL